MSKLLIIGNGFDLHHGMKTSYLNYREYLIEIGQENIVDCYEKQDEISPDYLWMNLEECIAMLPYEQAYCYLLSY